MLHDRHRVIKGICVGNRFRIDRFLGYENGLIISDFRFRLSKSRHDSSVGIELGYGLDDRGSRVRFAAGAGNFSLHHRV
jgi:hypothetical protein